MSLSLSSPSVSVDDFLSPFSLSCPVCGDDRFDVLGTLGLLTWIRCRACGSEWTDGVAPSDGEVELDSRLPAWA